MPRNKNNKAVSWVERIKQIVRDYPNREFKDYLQCITFNIHLYKLVSV